MKTKAKVLALSIYEGHCMDMLVHAVGRPITVSAIAAIQFLELTLSVNRQVSSK